MEKIQQLNEHLQIDTTKAEIEKHENAEETQNNNTKKNASHRIENGYVLVLL